MLTVYGNLMSNLPPRVIKSPKQSETAFKGSRRFVTKDRQRELVDKTLNDEPVIEQPVTKQKGERHIRRKAVAIGALAAAGTLIYGAVEVNDWNNKINNFKEAEATALTNDTRAPGALSGRVIVLRSGVKFRSTPNSIDANPYDLHVDGHHLMSGNGAGTVLEGQELVVAKPRVFLDKGGSTWLGFVIANGSVSSKQKSPDAVADDMMWVNASKLDGSKQLEMSNPKTGQLTPLTVADLDKSLQTSKLNEYGQYTSDSGNPIAWSPGLQPSGTYELNHQADTA